VARNSKEEIPKEKKTLSQVKKKKGAHNFGLG
jgi:hypothetical protein